VKPYVFHPEAEAEFVEALGRYAAISEPLGRRFYATIETLLGEIGSAPQRFPYVRRPVRRHFGKVFPYALIFVDDADAVVVLAVAHFRRRPGYWRSRLRG
jgi:hypothetical protein